MQPAALSTNQINLSKTATTKGCAGFVQIADVNRKIETDNRIRCYLVISTKKNQTGDKFKVIEYLLIGYKFV